MQKSESKLSKSITTTSSTTTTNSSKSKVARRPKTAGSHDVGAKTITNKTAGCISKQKSWMSEIMTKVGNPRCFQGFLRPGRAGPGGHGGQQLLVDHDAKLVLIFMLKLTLTPLPMLLMLAEIFAALFLHQAWRRRKNYDPMAAAGKKKEVRDMI